MSERGELPDSLWAATADSWPANPLQDDIATEVLIIGAGYTGLSAALHLSNQGHKATVIDAVEPGFGASGRNGGQVIPGLKFYPNDVIRLYGQEQGEKIIRSTNTSADLVFELIAKHDINCFASRNGFIQPAFSRSSCKVIEDRVRQLNRFGADVELLDKQTTTEYLGTEAYHKALLDPRGGSIQPLSYAQGLAKAAIKLGAEVYTQTRATNIERKNDAWVIYTSGAQIKADKVFVCTNAYSDFSLDRQILSSLNRSIVPLYSFQVATKPLSGELRSTILPQGHVASDTRRLLNYFRLDHTGRLVFGGRGGVNDANQAADYNHVVERIVEVFPQLKTPEIDYYWSGKVALTLDGVPHIHELGPGLYAGLGFNGRGVGMATLMGKWLASITSEKLYSDDYIPISKLKPIQFQQLRKPVISLAYLIKSMQDKFETYQ